jgi:hypothetical protein
MEAERLRLTPELKTVALDALKAFLQSPPGPDGRTLVEADMDLDRKRIELIEDKLKPLLSGYLANSLPLLDFKRQVDGIN